MRGIALLLLALPLAGCAQPGGGCEPPFPLVIQAYPSVSDATLLEVQTTLWNCAGGPIPLDDPCEARDGLMPAITVDGARYYLALPDGPARPREEVACFPSEAPARTALEPGGYLSQRYRWDGTLARDGALDRVAPGSYVMSVEAGRHYASTVVEVPW